MTHILSKETCAALKEMGVKTKSDFRWHSKIDDKGNSVHTELIYLPIDTEILMEQDCYAYTLSDLPHILREIGGLRKWQKIHMYACYSLTEGGLCDCIPTEPVRYHWIQIAELFIDGGIEASEAYLLTLIT